MTLRTCSSWAGRRSGGAAPSEFPYQSPTSGGSWPVSWEDGGGAEGIRTPFQALVARVAPALTWTVGDSRGHRDPVIRRRFPYLSPKVDLAQASRDRQHHPVIDLRQNVPVEITRDLDGSVAEDRKSTRLNSSHVRIS